MRVSRRDFLKISGMAAGSLFVRELGFNMDSVEAKVPELKIDSCKVTPTICPYCACGCGILVYTKGGQMVGTEGDPDHPINQGALCSKGSAVRQVYESEKRVTKPLYRAPGSDRWEEKDWDWMLNRIAERVKETRDKYFETDQNGIPVNRTHAIANLGGAALDNEEGYLLHKFARMLGVVYLEHQARI